MTDTAAEDKRFVPTTDQVRRVYVGEPPHWLDDRVADEFDRWLEQERDDAWGGGYQHARDEVKREIDNLNLRINNALRWCYSHDNPDAVPGSFGDLMLSEAAHVANLLKGTPTHE